MGVLQQKKAPPKDFVKQKKKVGKTKQAAKNDTRTDFKVKRVQMPAQSAILAEKGGEVTHRRLGLLELLAHTAHHSPKARRDAFRGLLELCHAHEGVLRSNLARIVEASSLAPVDQNSEVRKAFRQFMDWLLEELHSDAVAAFAPALALHVRSALSHVSAEVRDDGLLLLELYLARLGTARVFGDAEAARLVAILCQLTARADTSLACLYRLLDGQQRSQASDRGLAAVAAASPAEVSLHSVLNGCLLGGAEDASFTAQSREEGEEDLRPDSPVWAFCIRTWLQASELPGGAGAGAPSREAAARSSRVRLRVAAVLETSLHLSWTPSGGSVARTAWAAALLPSASQVRDLVNVVKRGEWPLRVSQASGGARGGPAAATNLRMVRVLAVLAAGAAPPEAPRSHLAILARAASGRLLDVAGAPWEGGGAADLATASAASAGPGPSVTSSEGDGVELAGLSGATGIAHALRSLDLLWCCTAAAAGTSSGEAVLAEAADASTLVGAVARLLAGGGGGGDEAARFCSAPALLALPLAAVMLGVSPTAAAAAADPSGSPPRALFPAWPVALIAAGEPCLWDAVERTVPGAASDWVLAWPKLLWYLGHTAPELSAFVLGLLLETAKHVERAGSHLAPLFLRACPLLMPYFAGMPAANGSSDVPPPVTRLPSSLEGLTGPQGQAVALLAHLPAFSENLMYRLSQLVCRWSDVGTAGDEVQAGSDMAACRLSPACCGLILEQLLRGGGSDLLRARLRVVLALARASPRLAPRAPERAARAEAVALQLCDAAADWLMAEGAVAAGATGAGGSAMEDGGLDYDGGRRLALQVLALPLCARAAEDPAADGNVAAGAATGPAAPPPRTLCFFFLCAARTPPPAPGAADPRGVQDAESDAEWCAFLREAFEVIVLRSSGRSVAADAAGTGAAAALAAVESPLCNPGRCGGLSDPSSGFGSVSAGAALADASRRLAQMFVAAWMRSVPASRWPLAYELLAKLCAQHLAGGQQRSGSASASAGGSGSGGGSARGADGGTAWSLCAAAALLLAAAIGFRNEREVARSSWGSPAIGLGVAHLGDVALGPAGPQEVQAAIATELKRLGNGQGAAGHAPGLAAALAELKASLRLL